MEAKAHGLRSTGSSVERTPCPFPAQFGGRANCGIAEEDEADEVLMGVLSAIAFYVSVSCNPARPELIGL